MCGIVIHYRKVVSRISVLLDFGFYSIKIWKSINIRAVLASLRTRDENRLLVSATAMESRLAAPASSCDERPGRLSSVCLTATPASLPSPSATGADRFQLHSIMLAHYALMQLPIVVRHRLYIHNTNGFQTRPGTRLCIAGTALRLSPSAGTSSPASALEATRCATTTAEVDYNKSIYKGPFRVRVLVDLLRLLA
jgi:hypothetical protein